MTPPKPPAGKAPVGNEAASLQTTRQMLDELDALMERMLALPVNELDDTAAPMPDVVRMPTVSATLTVLETPVADAPPEAPLEFEVSLRPSAFAGYVTDLAAPPADTPTWAGPAEPDPIPEEMIPPSVMSLPAPVLTPLTFQRRALGSLCLLPLVLVNKGFDKGAALLGRPGSFLRSQRGRHLLGMTGLGLLLAAALWLLKDWIGWTW